MLAACGESSRIHRSAKQVTPPLLAPATQQRAYVTGTRNLGALPCLSLRLLPCLLFSPRFPIARRRMSLCRAGRWFRGASRRVTEHNGSTADWFPRWEICRSRLAWVANGLGYSAGTEFGRDEHRGDNDPQQRSFWPPLCLTRVTASRPKSVVQQTCTPSRKRTSHPTCSSERANAR